MNYGGTPNTDPKRRELMMRGGVKYNATWRRNKPINFRFSRKHNIKRNIFVLRYLVDLPITSQNGIAQFNWYLIFVNILMS